MKKCTLYTNIYFLWDFLSLYDLWDFLFCANIQYVSRHKNVFHELTHLFFLFFFSFYRTLRPITDLHNLLHFSLSFANFSGLPTQSIRKFWFSSSIHLFFGLPNTLLFSDFQFSAYSNFMPLDINTYSSQLNFLTLSVWMKSQKFFNFIIRILLADYIVYVQKYVRDILHSYKIFDLTKALYNRIFRFFFF